MSVIAPLIHIYKHDNWLFEIPKIRCYPNTGNNFRIHTNGIW